MFTVQDVEVYATELYARGEYALLEAAWDITDNKMQIPNIAVNLAKCRIKDGEVRAAHPYLDTALESYKNRQDNEGIARVYLMQGTMFANMGDLPLVEWKVAQVFELTQSHRLRGEGHNLLANVKYLSQPAETLEHLKKAERHFLMARTENPTVAGDLVRVYVRWADLCGDLGQDELALQYYKAAEELASQVNNEGLNAQQVIFKGIQLERMGSYKKALEVYNEARHLVHPQDHARWGHVTWHRAWLIALMGDDEAALREIQQLFIPDVQSAHCSFQAFLTRGYIYLFRNQLDLAGEDARQAEQIAMEGSSQVYRAQMLKAAIQISRGAVTEKLILQLNEIVLACEEMQYPVDLSWAYLLLAWACAVSPQHTAEVKPALANCLRASDRVKHVLYLYRLFMLSFSALNRHWKTFSRGQTFLHKMEKTVREIPFRTYRDDQIVLLGLRKAPEIYKNGKRILRTRNEKNLAAAFIFFMAHEKQATADEIINALWSEDEQFQRVSALQNNFSVLKNRLKEAVHPQWLIFENGLYTLNEEVVAFADMIEFEKVWTRLAGLSNPADKLAELQHTLILYEDDYLRDLDHPYFDEHRRHYKQIYCKILRRAIELATTLDDLDLAAEFKAQLEADSAR